MYSTWSIAHSRHARNLFVTCCNFIDELNAAEHVISQQLVGENENPLAVRADILHTHYQISEEKKYP